MIQSEDRFEMAYKIGIMGGASTTATGLVADMNAAAWIGAVVLLTTTFINWVYKRRADRRAQERHDIEIERLRRAE